MVDYVHTKNNFAVEKELHVEDNSLTNRINGQNLFQPEFFRQEKQH